jgi:hypothetical protein
MDEYRIPDARVNNAISEYRRTYIRVLHEKVGDRVQAITQTMIEVDTHQAVNAGAARRLGFISRVAERRAA